MVSSRSSSICKLHVGRLLATKYLLQGGAITKNRKLWDSVKALTDQYRSLLAQSLSIETLSKELREAELKKADMIKNLDDQVSKVGFTYTTLLHPTFRPDMIINRTEATDPKLANTVIMNCKLVRYVFCTDTVLDCDDPSIVQITLESLALTDATPPDDGNTTPKKQSKTKTSSHQHSPSKMDAERSLYD